MRIIAPLGWNTGRPEPISSGNENRSSSVAEPAMVAALGLRQPLEVRLQLVLARPRGAVDALQLRILLAAAPVRGGAAHQREPVPDQPGRRQVRAAAQVLPRHDLVALAVAGDVVVDRQLAGTDLGARTLRRALGVAGALQPDQLELVGLARELGACLVLGDHPATEPLAGVDELLHRLLELLQVLRLERGLDIEVVVEPVGDRWPDPRAWRPGSPAAPPARARARSSGAGSPAPPGSRS